MTYTPNAGYHGPDRFTFKANDGRADSNIAMVSIAVWSAQPDPLGRFSHFLPKANWVRLDYPLGIAVGPDGSVYVANSGSHPVRVFDRNGNSIKKWGAVGNEDGEIKQPEGITRITLGPDGSIYVIDRGNYRIQKFDGNGTFITKWGSRGNGNGQFYQPDGIIVGSDGSVYVLDSALNNIQKFDGNGNFVAKWGSWGSGDGQFYAPTGLAKGWMAISMWQTLVITVFKSSTKMAIFWPNGEATEQEMGNS